MHSFTRSYDRTIGCVAVKGVRNSDTNNMIYVLQLNVSRIVLSFPHVFMLTAVSIRAINVTLIFVYVPNVKIYKPHKVAIIPDYRQPRRTFKNSFYFFLADNSRLYTII